MTPQDEADKPRRPGESRDPLSDVTNVLRVFARQPAVWDFVRRRTSNLVQRVWQHKSKAVPGFTSKYGVDRLVWFETQASPDAAIRREKQIKEWKRAWKIQLIETDNPHWLDLYQGLPA